MAKMFVLVVVTLLLAGCGVDVAPEPVELSPAQIKQQAMEDAAYYDETVFEFPVYDEAGGKYALCYGTQRIVYLRSGETKRIKLSLQEAANLSFCKENSNGGYNIMSGLGNASPGDYFAWVGEARALRVTTYTP